MLNHLLFKFRDLRHALFIKLLKIVILRKPLEMSPNALAIFQFEHLFQAEVYSVNVNGILLQLLFLFILLIGQFFNSLIQLKVDFVQLILQILVKLVHGFLRWPNVQVSLEFLLECAEAIHELVGFYEV